MAIAFDTSSVATIANPATSVTWSHTTASGSDRFMIVAGGCPTSDKLTDVKYNAAAAMTVIESFQLGDNRGCYLHYMVAPDTGTHNVVITGSSDAWIGASATYTGVDQSSPIDDSVTNRDLTNPVNNIDFAVTTTVEGCWGVYSGRAGIAGTNGSNTTLRRTAGGLAMGDTNGSLGTSGSYNINYAISSDSTTGMGGVGAAFKPVQAAASTFTPKMMMF